MATNPHDRFHDRTSIRKRALVMLAALEPPALRSELESLVAPRDRYLAAAVLLELAGEGLLEFVDTGVARVRLTAAGREALLARPGESRPYAVGLPGGEAGRT